jgi:hypothetical protein
LRRIAVQRLAQRDCADEQMAIVDGRHDRGGHVCAEQPFAVERRGDVGVNQGVARSGIAAPTPEVAIACGVDLCEEGVEFVVVWEAVVVRCLQCKDFGASQWLCAAGRHTGVQARAPPSGNVVVEFWV